MYSVINKEGHKVLGYKTIKKCDFHTIKRFIASKNMGHFVIFVICLIISTKISISNYRKKCAKLAKFDIFKLFWQKNQIFYVLCKQKIIILLKIFITLEN